MGKKSAKQVTNFLGTSALTRPLFALGAASVLFGTGPAHALDANTLPQNPNVVGGKDSFSQSGSTLNVNQQTNRTVIDWRSFDIGSKAQVNFSQPGTSSIAVNRVNGSTNPSDIEGGLHANGQVWILNPNGVFFGKSARVDAAGIVATTANINDKAFMAGSNKLQMTGADHGSVVNEGRVTVGQNGLAAFVAPSVRNSGTINATVGRVALAAGTTYTLDLAGDHLVELGLGSVKAVVDNTGKIVNPGGTIALTAKAAGQVVNSVVNVSGTVSASSATKSGGTIILGADTVNTTKTASITADAGTNGTGGTITSVANKVGNYAGTFSAQGGSKSGNGGKIETSGHSVTIGDNISVDTRSAHGILGNWTVDPIDIAIVSGSGGDTVGAGGSITEGAIENALLTTSVTITTDQGTGGNGDISLQTAINSAGPGSLTLIGRHLSAASGADTISLAGALTLDVNYVSPTTPGATWINDALGMIGTVAGGTTINLGAGTYSAGTTINKNDVTLNGSAGAKIAVGTGQTGVTIDANNVTVENIEFAGPLAQAYTNYTWSGVGDPGNSWAIQVTHATNSNFNIENNNIHDVRTGILIANSGNPATGAASGAITGNTFDNTKGGVIVQYRDGSTVNISGNRSGTTGNEWGVVYNTNLSPAIIATTASSSRQAALLAVANANTGLAVLDRGYTYANRTSVTVDDNATGTPDNGYGNARQPLATIQAGIDAVVSGGTVNVLDGTYTISSGYINVNKSLNLIGQSEAGVIIDARNASTYGLRVTATDGAVDLENFTLYGVTASGGYGLKAEATNGLTLENITSQGAYKSEFDLNGVLNGTLDHLLANGYSVGTTTMTGGNGISFTNSQNITLTNSVTENNGWGGLALYQGTTYGNLQLTGITVNGSNTFNEANGIYAEDQSAATDIGTVNLAGQGITYIAQDLVAANDFYTWFRTSKQGAIDAAVAASPTTSYVQGYAGNVSGNNNFYVGLSTGGTAMSIQAAVNAAAAGANVNVAAGNYTLSGELDITKSLTLTGAGQGVTNITSSSTGYGIFVDANNTTLSNFTYNASANGTYGLKIQAVPGSASNRLLNFDIDHVTINGSKKTGLDLNGVLNATIDHVNVNNTSAGNGIALTDSANITITNSSTTNNAWGGLALYQTNATFDQQVTNIVVNGTNTFHETNGIYAQDQSASKDFGIINLAGQGIQYIAQLATGGSDGIYTFFQKTKQGAIDLAVAFNTRYASKAADVQGYAGNVSGDNTFYVGTSGGTAMAIQGAVDAAVAGATINVDAGTYTDAINIGKNVDIEGAGAGQTIIQPTALLTTGVGHKYDSNVKTAVYVHDANDVTINGVTIDANNLGANAVVFWNNASGTISNAIIENPMAFSGVQTGQGIAVDATGANTTNLTVDNVTFQNWNKNAIDAVTGDGTGTNGGTINLTVTDSDFIGRGDTGTIAQNGILTWEQGGGTVNATIDNDSFSSLSFSDPNVATATGVLVYGSANGTVVVENSTFASSVQEYISTAGGSPNEVDATNGNTFGGVAISSATLNQLYAIEDKITDGTDDSSNGLVRLVAGHVYATAQKDNLQAAVDVASIGDTINVQAGTYTSALDIDKNVDIEGAGAGQTIIQPTALLTTGVGHKYDSNVKTAVYVHDASDVTLNGLTIDANNLGANAVVFWNNASGTISNAIIENPMAFSGAQTGQGIAVDATGANTTDLTVDNVTFQNWNKNAIDAVTGDGTGTNGGTINLTVTDSDFIGRGDTGTIAQNGILTWEQGGGTVNATIDGDSFSDLSFNDPNVATATGVLVYGTANGTVTVSNSTFASSVQDYISTAGGSTHEVDATDGNTFGGVAISSATLDQIFAIVDKITDGIDDTSNGLVRLVDGQVYVTAAKGDIAAGVTKAAAGDTVNVQDGSYTLANELDITKRLTLKGESQDGTVITSNSTGYGINVTADNVSLLDFTFNAPTAHTGSTYGIKVTPDTNVASDRLLNFDIENVTINGGYRTGLDLNGVVNATINNVSVSNVQNGNGIALTDSKDITLTNVTTTGNAWGGLALYQTNYFYDQQLTGINVDTSNHFNEANGIYLEDQSDGIGTLSHPSVVGGSGLDAGTLNIAGYDYVAIDKSNSADQYEFFQKTKQDALNFATDATANHNHLTLANTYVEGWTGSALNNIFEVGFNTAGDKSLTIQAAENAATAGGTINVGSGTYAEDVSVGTQLTFNFGDVDVNSFTLTSGAAGSTLNGDLTATGAITSAGAVTLSGDFAGASIGLSGAVTLAGDTTLDASGTLTVASVTGGSHDLELTGGSISLGNVSDADALTVDDAATLTGTSYAGNSLEFDGAVTLTGDTTMNASGAITVASVTGAGNDLELDGASASLGDVAGVGALVVDSSSTLTGTSYSADSLEFDGAVTLSHDTTMDASGAVTVASVTGAGNDLEIGGASISLGNVAGVDALKVDDASTLTGTSYSAGSLEFDDAVTLSGNTTMDAGGAITVASVIGAGNDLELDGASASLGNVSGVDALVVDSAATLTGTSYSANSLEFDGAITLSGDTTMDATGAITVASVTGVGHDLELDGASASLGNVSGVDALVVDSVATLTGSSYSANSLEFDGAVTLTHDTTMNASGALTVASVVGAGKDLELDGSSISLGNVAGADVLTVDDAATLTGTSYAGNSLKFNGLVTLSHDTTMTGTNNVTVASVTGAGMDLSISSASNLLGNVDSVDALTVTGAAKLTGTSYGANDMSFGAVTLTGDTTLNARNTVTVASVTGGSHDLSVIGISASLGNVAGVDALAVNAAATLTGSSYSANSMSFDSLTLAHDAVLTASGNITTGSVTGGGNDLSLTGAAVSVGNVAGVDALAVTGPATLTGATYAANSISFGSVSLTHDTTMNATGNLTVASVAGNNKDLSITGASNALGNVAGVDVLTVAGATTLTGTSYVADSIGFDAITLTGDTTLDASGNVTVASVTGAGNDLSIDGVSNALGNVAGVGALAVTGPVGLTGTSYAANSIGMDEVTLTGDTTLDASGNIVLASVTGAGNDLSIDGASNTLGNIAGVGALAVTGPSTLTGTSYAANSAAFGAVTLTGDTTIDAGTIAVASVTGGGNDLTLDGAASLGNVAGVDALAVTGTSTLTGTSYAANSMAFGGAVTLTGDTTLDATGAVTLASVTGGGNDLEIDAASTTLGNVAGAGALVVDGASKLVGTSYVADSMNFGGAVTLANSVALNTSGDDGAIVLASVDGTSAGGQALNINAGKGKVSLGNLGAGTRLGAVTDASATTLTGSTYKANSFLFGGAVTLTAATTTLNTTQSSSAAGDITFQGDIFGKTDGGQSLTLIAGSGKGAASANGDITLQNAGTSSVEFGDLTVSGNNFTALTVDLAGNFSATLTGNQVFAADTLNAKGNVNSTVGGDASGHIVSGGDVNVAAKGDVSGNISGTNVTLSGDDVNSTVTASNSATVTGNTVEGSYTAQTVSITAADNVDAAVNATNFRLSAADGSVDGTWTNVDTNGSGVVDLNGQHTVGQGDVNPNQLVVEGFTLPAGTTIGANGQLILPQGVLLGLLSPGGGKPKMILVHTVQQLGELLAGGYTVIVIDLSNRDSGKPIQLASN